MINIDFELKEPKESDFHSIKVLLKQYLDNSIFNRFFQIVFFLFNVFFYSNELVEMIISQSHIGSVIKVDDNEGSFGFISVINFHKNKVFII